MSSSSFSQAEPATTSFFPSLKVSMNGRVLSRLRMSATRSKRVSPAAWQFLIPIERSRDTLSPSWVKIRVKSGSRRRMKRP